MRPHSRPEMPDFRPVTSSLEKRRVVVHLAIFTCDLIMIACAYQLAAFVYLGVLPSDYAATQSTLFIPIFAILAMYNNVYSIRSLTSLSFALSRVVASAFLAFALLVFATFYMAQTGDLSRAVMTLGVAFAVFAIAAFRWALHRSLLNRWVPDIDSVLIVRDGGPALKLPKATVLNVGDYGLDVSLDDPTSLDRFGVFVENADRVIVSCPVEKRNNWAFILRAAGVEGEVVSTALHELRPIALKRHANFISLQVSSRPLGFRARVIKRMMDLVISGIALILLSPIFGLIALAIKLDDPGPVFFIQRRMGRGNRFFDMIKFRSMAYAQTDHVGARSASRDDKRITRVGNFLRKTSLDEISQLLNVIRGDMSLVGPRPHALGSLAGEKLFWEVERNYWHRHSLKPGLTGLAQIRGLRGATDEEHHLTRRLDADLEYIARWSPWRDLWIMLMTARVLVHDRAF